MANVTKLNSTAAKEALKMLEEAWSYYTPQPLPKSAIDAEQPDLFQYHNAA